MKFTEPFFVNHIAKLAYFPINKNASTTYSSFFRSCPDWETTPNVSHDIHSYRWIAHIQNPRSRYIKGITEILDSNGLVPHLESHPLNVFLLRTHHDKHLVSIYELFEEASRCVNFIPMEGNCNHTTYTFLKKLGIEYPELLTMKNMNVSKPRKQRVQDRIQTLISEYPKGKEVYEKRIAPYYSDDFRLWKNSQSKIKNEVVQTYEEYLYSTQTVSETVSNDTFFERLKYAYHILFKS